MTLLQEIYLLKCSLLPGEFLVFNEDAEDWDSLLDSCAVDPDRQLDEVLQPAHFQVKLAASSNIYFDVELLSARDQEIGMPIVTVKGDSIGRTEQERWQTIVSEAWRSVEGSEYPLYELMSTHLLPQIHASLHADERSGLEREPVPQCCSARYHALFVSHHLKSPQKRRSLSQWSHELSLMGFAKVGHPGVIYCDGAQEEVEDFVDRVKSMQWLALRLRFIEPLPQQVVSTSGECSNDESRRPWTEFEKVGEVVEEMRRLGRESFVVEMGIGRTNNIPSSQ